ncbi:MAG: S41 family peptidase, partial [Filifactoraceae bacterium]
ILYNEKITVKNYIINNYVNWNEWNIYLKKKIIDLDEKDINYYTILSKILESLCDPHVSLEPLNFKVYHCPIFMNILNNRIIVVEDYKHIKKGFILKSIDDVEIFVFLNKYKKCKTNNLKLIKILKNIVKSHDKKTLKLEYIDNFGEVYNIEVQYVENITNDDISIGGFLSKVKDLEKSFYDKIKKEFSIAYYKLPPLINLELINEFINNLDSEIMDKVIIDVRNNFGGRIDLIIPIVEFFNNSEKRIFLRSKNQNKTILIEGKNRYKNRKIVILINELTCSCLEYVFLSSIKGQENITLIGTETCGMSDIATVSIIMNGFLLILSTKKYTDKNGKDLDIKFIAPDVFVENSINDFINERDKQLESAIEYLSY